MKKAAKILFRVLLFTFIVMFFLLFFTSCSDKTRANRLARKGYRLLKKASELDPTIADTINGKKKVVIDVPGDSGSQKVKPVIDTTKFEKKLRDYDSLRDRIYDLEVLINQNPTQELTLEKAKVEAELKYTKNELKKTKKELSRGFSVDSTYVKEDSLIMISITVKDGLLNGFDYKIKDRTVSTDVNTKSTTLNAEKPVWKYGGFWICILIILLLLAILVLSKR